MATGILVLASKRVGLELVRYLLDSEAPVERVIAATPADAALVALATRRGVAAEGYTPATQATLIQERRRYAWLLNLWSPHRLRGEFLSLFDHRLNVHPGLVPLCRGNDNAAWTIRKRLPAGVALLEMREQIDAGEVYVQRPVPYTFPTRGQDLHHRLQEEAIRLFRDAWPAIYAGTLVPKPQCGKGHYHTRRQTERDRVLPATAVMSLEDFVLWILAHDFSPRTTAEMRYRGRTYRLTLTVTEGGTAPETDDAVRSLHAESALREEGNDDMEDPVSGPAGRRP